MDAEELATRLVDIITSRVKGNNDSLLPHDQAIRDTSECSEVECPERSAVLLFSDIDGTLKKPREIGTVDEVQLEVQRAIARINGIDGAVFFIPTSRCDIELADSTLPGLRLATIASNGAYVRAIDGRCTLHPLPEIPISARSVP